MKNKLNRSTAMAMTLAGLSVGALARAGDVYWLGSGTTPNWSNPNNWNLFDRPDNDGQDDVNMEDVLQYTTNIVNQDFWISRLLFNPYDGREAAWTINQSNDAVLSVSRGIGNSTSKTQTVNVPLRLRSGIYIGNNGDGTQNRGLMNIGAIDLNGNNLTLSASPSGINLTGTISGAGNLIADGSGPVTLSASNTWTGDLVIYKGSVVANFGANLGSISNRVGFAQTDANSIPTLVRNASGTIAIPLFFESGEGRIQTSLGTTVTISSALNSGTGDGDFAKTGPGTVVLASSANQYRNTIVRGGTLQLAASNAVSGHAMQVLNGTTLSLNANVSQTVSSLDGFGSVQLGNSTTFSVGRTTNPTDTNNGTGNFGGVISGGSTLLNKQGAGTFVLSGSNTYGGVTDVYGGVLVVNNTLAGSSATGTSNVSVRPGARLAGDGSTAAEVLITSNGQIAPSNANTPDAGIGSLGTGPLVLQAGAITRIDFDTSAIDRINANGTASIEGELRLTKIGNAIPSLGSVRQLLSSTASRIGVFSSITGVSLSSKESFAVTYTGEGIFATIAIPGDINLDRAVNFDDLLTLAQNYGGGEIQTWSSGDMTGDGSANFDDLLILAQNYGIVAVGLSGQFVESSDFVADWAVARSMVPEPTFVGAVAAVAPALRRNRR